ncbi:hypothetical protein Q783_03690 [Carnobacterium inhibens subsp. gilichinskyi]|uniref:Uncharacterized protein n=1 Tax=Carnobacterium inhibens subsp. gilichinskyi TaxID=1266845 RepID=U5SBW5_9LACT|nr:hypothetical protein Q783_03690 [Carnobacterium inhibens subsp. gilichinskyi]
MLQLMQWEGSQNIIRLIVKWKMSEDKHLLAIDLIEKKA